MKSISKPYSAFMALTMILCSYSFSFFSKLSFAYLGLLLFVVIIFFKKMTIPSGAAIRLIVLLTCVSLFSVLIQSSSPDINRMIIYIGKYFIWGLILSSMFINESFDKKFFYKCVYIISIISTFYLTVQIIAFSFANIKLPNTLAAGILKVSSDDGNTVTTYRPASFFCEPAYYSTYSLCALAIVLFDKIKIENKGRIAAFLTIGIFLSTSTAGMYMIVAIYLIFALYYITEKKGRISKNAIILVFVIIGLAALIIPNYKNILSHMGSVGNALIRSINKLQHAETSSRLGGSYDKLDNLNHIQRIIGCGIGNEYVFLNSDEVYMNSITRLIIQTGYIGLITFSFFVIRILLKYNDKFSIFILLMYVVKCITGGAMFSIPGLFMLTFIFIQNIQEKNREEACTDIICKSQLAGRC